MIWSLIGSIGGKVLDIVDDVVEDKVEANRVKFEIQRQLIENKSNELEAAAKIVLAEAQGSRLQRNWRPLLMVTFFMRLIVEYISYKSITYRKVKFVDIVWFKGNDHYIFLNSAGSFPDFFIR